MWTSNCDELTGQTFEGAMGSDVMNNEPSNEDEQNHEQFRPGESTTSHLHLQILHTEEKTLSKGFLLLNVYSCV